MIGTQGSRRLVTIERKTFELSVVGREEDNLKISENGRGRTNTVIILKNDIQWLINTWTDFWNKSQATGWFRRRRTNERTLMFQMLANKWGRTITMSVVKKGVFQSVVCPEGPNKEGWKRWSNVMLDLIKTAEGGQVTGTQRVTHEAIKGDKRSWKEVVLNHPGEGAQKAKHSLNAVGKEFIAELCCGNCGWTLRGSFKTMEDKSERSISHQTLQETNRRGRGPRPRQTTIEGEQAGKGNGDRERKYSHVYKAKSVSNFELNSKGRERHAGLTNDINNNKRLLQPTSKSNKETAGMVLAVTRATTLGNQTESRKEVEERQEVHNWIQMKLTDNNNVIKKPANREQGKDGNKKFQVYRRKCNSTHSGSKSDGDIRFWEPIAIKKVFSTEEYVKKLKGIQQIEQEIESETDSDPTIRPAGEWDRGECSTWEANKERALVPINQEADSTSEKSSMRSREGYISRNPSDIWNSTKDINLEEQIRIWIMRNLFYMGERLGLRLDGRKEDMIKIAHEIQERSQEVSAVSKRATGSSKRSQEIKRLKSNINYERRGLRRIRNQSKVEKKYKGSAVSC